MAAHVVVRGRVWCIKGNAFMEWMGMRRGWREVEPYPPGLKAGTARAVCIGVEKVVVTGALDIEEGGGRHALWVFDVKSKSWTVVRPPPEFAGSSSLSPPSGSEDLDLVLRPVVHPSATDQET